MFLRDYSVIQLALLGLVSTSCGKQSAPSPNGPPYKAVVVALTGVDNSGSAKFALEERTFPALKDLNNLDGTYLRILRGGALTVSEVNGSIVAADSFSGGESPKLRYTLDGEVVLASDYSSLAMLSGYYQMDYIYSKVLDVLGIEPSKLQEKLPGGKHTVLFEPQIVFKFDSASGSAGIKLNAAFSPKDKQFLLFQRSGIENIPLAANLQVISHEFGHSVFDYSFFEGIYDEKNYLGETFALRGLNEGWADFVSWNFTKSADILRSSINIAEIANERHATKTTFTWSDVVLQSLGGAPTDKTSGYGECSSSFYCIGTIFARSLIQAKTELSSIDEKTFANGILVSLQSAQADMNAQAAANPAITPVATSDDSASPNTSTDWIRQGQFTGGFLRAIVKNSPASFQATLCKKFSDNFPGDGFSDTARNGVCP
jgi:hypothetical protein